MAMNTGKPTGKTEVFGLDDDDDANVEDFMSRFSNPRTHVAPDEAQRRFEQFDQKSNPELREAVDSYLSQMDPETFARATQNLDPEQRAGFASGLLNALKGMGIDLSDIARSLGLSSTDPQQMHPDDLGRLTEYAQRNAPEAFQKTTREQPFILRALGNPLVQGALAIMAARYMSRRGR